MGTVRTGRAWQAGAAARPVREVLFAPSAGGAFTLFEMLLVMAIIGMVVGLLVPIMIANVGEMRMTSAADRLMSACRRAHFEATGAGRVHRLNFRTEAGTYWITVESDPLNAPGLFDRVEESWGRTIALPERIVFGVIQVDRLEAVDAAALSECDAIIEFFPDGRTSGALITLAYRNPDADGDATVTVSLDPATGRVEIVSEAERREIETEVEGE